MSRALFWIAATVLLAIVAHLTYVLIVPQQAMSRLIRESAGIAGTNTFLVLDGEQQESILKESRHNAVAGLCAFDLADGELVLDVSLPNTVWSLTVYSDAGENTYAINDRQAGTNRFQLTLKQSPGLLGLLSGDNTGKGLISDGWTVETPSRRGLAVVWAGLDDQNLRKPYANMIAQSSCRIEQSS